MEESQRKDKDGRELLETIIELTGLPQDVMKQELSQIISEAGVNKESVTLDELRTVLIQYLESMNEEVMAENAPGIMTLPQ